MIAWRKRCTVNNVFRKPRIDLIPGFVGNFLLHPMLGAKVTRDQMYLACEFCDCVGFAFDSLGTLGPHRAERTVRRALRSQWENKEEKQGDQFQKAHDVNPNPPIGARQAKDPGAWSKYNLFPDEIGAIDAGCRTLKSERQSWVADAPPPIDGPVIWNTIRARA